MLRFSEGWRLSTGAGTAGLDGFTTQADGHFDHVHPSVVDGEG